MDENKAEGDIYISSMGCSVFVLIQLANEKKKVKNVDGLCIYYAQPHFNL